MEQIEDNERCGFYVKRKRRLCRMLPAKGNTHCAEHLCFQKDQQGVKRNRVKCPLDPSHTVFEDRLEKHRKICNSTKKKVQEFYEENKNSGMSHESNEKIPLNAVPKEEIHDLIQRISECHTKLNLTIFKCLGEHKVLEDELGNQEYGPTKRKHLIQQASLINILEKNGAFHENTAFIEFGAGKGKLSHWLQKAVGNTGNVSYVLIDRQNTRNKFDCYHKGEDQGPSFKRLNIDIEHLNLGKVDDLNGRSLIGFGKHLCGSATDLSLRCLMDLTFNQSNITNAAKKPKTESTSESQIELILFALCCFHRCSWPSYVGKEYFLENGFTPVDFHRMTLMCSWATCGFRNNGQGSDQSVDSLHVKDNLSSVDNNKDDFSLDSDEKKKIGIQCKRIIDYGRMMYLEKNGYKPELLYYVSPDVTLEDVALLAKRLRVGND